MLKPGDIVRMQFDALIWGKPYGFLGWAYYTNLCVKDVDGDCVTVASLVTDKVVGNVHTKYLIKL